MRTTKTKIIFLLCVLLQSVTYLSAQNVKVTGTVVDQETGKPLGSVFVKVKNGSTAAETDTLGFYSISAPSPESVLTFSLVGYKIYEEKAGTQGALNVSMTPFSDNNLNEVVVVGYGSQSKRDVTGSMATINKEQIADLPVASVAEALRGQIPGLNVNGGSTRPGDMPILSVRQQFNWGKDGGGVTPLIVIDDVIQVDPTTGLNSQDRFNQLDLSEVESITVLKDASAAIYGSRASQGAIIVKTKRGKAGQARISYNGKFETNDAVSHGKVMNTRQYGEFVNKLGTALGWNQNNLYSDVELTAMDSLNYDWLANDWRAGNAMQHSVEVSGGTDRATYYTGVSYYTQNPNLGSQDFKRWTYRAGTDIKVANGLRFSATLAAASTDVEKSFTKINIQDGSYSVGGEQNDYSMLLHMPKYIPWMYNVNGVDQYISPPLGPNKPGNVSGNSSLSNWNYYALLNNGSKTTNHQFNYNANFSLQYDVPYVPGLQFKVNYGVSQMAGNTEQDMMPLLLAQASKIADAGKHLIGETAPEDWKVTLNKSNSRVSYMNTNTKSDQINFFVGYNKTFGEHSLQLMGSVERSTNNAEMRTQLYDNPIPGVYNGTSISAGTLNVSNSITTRTQAGTLSYLGRASYNYKHKYLLQFVFRTDASTIFAPEHYWGFFPGVSAGWVVSDESWFKNTLPWVSYFKLRASMGKTGNNNVKAWRWLQLYSAATDKGFGLGNNGGLYVTGLNPEVSPNRDLRWDNTYQHNFGVDVSFFNSRLSVAFDQYFNQGRDLLTAMSGFDIPISVGGAFAEQNYSDVNSWGSELSLSWKDHIKDFSYSISMNSGLSNYKVIKYFDQPFDYPSETTTRKQVGNTSIAPVWGYKTWKETSGGDGILRTDDDINKYWDYLTNNANNSGVAGAAPKYFSITDKTQMKKGMLAYQDIAGDLDANNKTIGGPNGRIADKEDWTKLRNSNRSYGISTNINLGWKGVSLLAQIATSWGGVNYLDWIKQGTGSTQSLWSQPIYLTDMFDPVTNPNGKYPNLAFYDNGGSKSDFFMMSSFRMVIRNLSVGYSLPKEWIKKAKIENARFFLSGQNLWDLYNPYPKKYRNMYDAPNTGYPTLRTWALGLSLGF